MGVVVGATPVSMRSCWEFHVHYWRMLIWKILRLLTIVLWRAVAGLVEHQVAIGETVIMHVRRSEFLLILVDLVQFWAHLPVSMTSAHLPAKDVSSLSGCSLWSLLIPCHSTAGTTWTSSRPLSLNLGHHLHLIRILHDKLACVSSVGGANTTGSLRTTRCMYLVGHYLALRGDCWYFVVVFLYWR